MDSSIETAKRRMTLTKYIWKEEQIEKIKIKEPIKVQDNLTEIVKEGRRLGKIQTMSRDQYLEKMMTYWKLNQIDMGHSIVWNDLLMPFDVLQAIFKLNGQKNLFREYVQDFRKWENEQFNDYMNYKKMVRNQKLGKESIQYEFQKNINLSIIKDVHETEDEQCSPKKQCFQKHSRTSDLETRNKPKSMLEEDPDNPILKQMRSSLYHLENNNNDDDDCETQEDEIAQEDEDLRVLPKQRHSCQLIPSIEYRLKPKMLTQQNSQSFNSFEG